MVNEEIEGGLLLLQALNNQPVLYRGLVAQYGEEVPADPAAAIEQIARLAETYPPVMATITQLAAPYAGADGDEFLMAGKAGGTRVGNFLRNLTGKIRDVGRGILSQSTQPPRTPLAVGTQALAQKQQAAAAAAADVSQAPPAPPAAKGWLGMPRPWDRILLLGIPAAIAAVLIYRYVVAKK